MDQETLKRGDIDVEAAGPVRCYIRLWLKVRGRERRIATKSHFFHHYVGQLKSGWIKEPDIGKISAVRRGQGTPREEQVRTEEQRPT